MIGKIFALLCAISWSLSMVFARKAQRKTVLEPMLGLFITVFVNNVINFFALIIHHFVIPPVPLNFPGIMLFVVGGVFNSYVGRGLLFTCVAILGAARAGLMKATVPLFVLFGGIFILGEQLGPLAWLGIGIVLFGLFLMSMDSARRSNDMPRQLLGGKNSKKQEEEQEREGEIEPVQDKRRRLFKGIAIGLASAFFLGTGNVCRKAGITLIPDTVLSVSFCSFFALLACVVTLLIQGKGRQMIHAIKNMELNYVISGVFTSGALYALFEAMRHIPISIANSISATEPLFTILFVWLFKEGKKETLGIRTMLFGLIMVAGTVILIMK